MFNEKPAELAQSERYFRTLVETSSDAIVLIDISGKVLYQTPSAQKILGYSLAELQEIDGIELIHPDDRTGDNEVFADLVSRPGSIISRKHRVKHKRGGYVHIEGTYCNLLHDKNVEAIVYSYKDISEKVLADQNLERYNRELTLLNQINDIILRDQDEFLLYKDVCACIVRSGGYKMAWICLKPDETSADQTVFPLATAGNPEYLNGARIDLNDPELSNSTTGIALKTGKIFVNNDTTNTHFFKLWIDRANAFGINSSIALPLSLGNGKSGALTIYSGRIDAFDSREVTVLERLVVNLSIALQHIQNRSELADSENRFRRAFEDSAIGMGLVSLEGLWIKVNRSLYEMLGYTENELLKLTFQEITHPDDLGKDLAFLQQTLRGEIDTYRMEKRYFHKDGSIVWINLNVSLIRDSDKTPLYFVSQIENITEKKETQDQFRNLVENFIVGVYILQDGKLVYVNPQVLKDTGYSEEEMLDKPCTTFIYKDDVKMVQDLLDRRINEGLKSIRYEARIQRKNGELLWYEILGSSILHRGTPALIGTMMNITERKAIYDELKDSEARFRGAFEESAIGMAIVSLEGKYLKTNQALRDMFGYSEDELLSLSFQEMTHLQDLEKDLELFHRALAGEIITYRLEKRYFRKDGSVIWANLNVTLITDYQKHPVYFVAQLENITEKKKAENEVLHLTRLYEFISHINEAMLKSETEDEIYSEACRIAVEIGRFQMAWVGAYDKKNDKIIPVAHSGHDDGFLEAIEGPAMNASTSSIPSARAIRNRSCFYYNDILNDLEIPSDIKNEMLKRNYLSGLSLPIFVDSEIVSALILLMSEPFFFNEQEIKLLSDVTGNISFALDKIRIRGLQAKYEANLKSIFDTTDVNYLLVDTDYNIVALNQNMRQVYQDLVNITLKEGMNLVESILPEKRKNAKKIYDKVVNSNRSLDYEPSYVNKGITRHFLANVKPINDGKKVIGLCISSIDITERKNALDQLKQLNDNLQAKARELAISNAELEQFAYVASHDLQEPLRMVTSFLTQLEKKFSGVLDEKAKQYIYFATDGAKRMRQLILDLLEFSRVGRTDELWESININDLLNEAQILFRRNIEETKADIRYEKLPTLQICKTPVRQIFHNLISNALKYHKPGISPIVEITFKELKGSYEFVVSDNGIGIDPEFFDQIFIIFKRLHNRDRYEGTGMGLAITKKIVEHMGGKIWVVSKEGEGSAFHFTVPKHAK